MPNWNQVIAIVCIAGLLRIPGIAEQHKRQAVTDVRGLVQEFGLGSDLKVTRVDGHKLRGQVSAIEGEGFKLLSRDSGKPSMYVGYDDIATLTLARRVYRSGKERDTTAARRVALALGRGHHVLTRVRSGKTYRGHIEAVDSHKFTLLLDHSGLVLPISYSEIDHLEENLSRAAKIGIVAAAVAAAVAIALIAVYRVYSENE
jgi:small nuclear ribonucleoprotein (snRNP)-like protein